MKKLLTLCLALIVCTFAVFAERVQIGDLYYNLDIDNRTAEVTYQELSFSGNYPNLSQANIPSTVYHEGVKYNITGIGAGAFILCRNLLSVTMPNSIIEIGVQAFWRDSSLVVVQLGDSVENIGHYAFEDCISLTSITIPDNVTSIGKYAFNGCSSLPSINVPSSVKSIGDAAFYGCTNLPIYDNIWYADTYLVGAADRSLSTYKIREGTKWIGSSAFQACENLVSITIPETVKSIEKYAFCDAEKLSSITIPNSVTEIKMEAFFSCYNLSSLVIGDNLTSIGMYAFADCYKLNSVSLPNSLASIGEGAFHSCTSLKSIIIPNNLKKIDNYVFAVCSSLPTIVIPNGVDTIGEGAFGSCSSLKSVTIPESVINIGYDAFAGCRRLSSVYNYASYPQLLDTTVFDFEGYCYVEEGDTISAPVNKNICKLYVPKESIGLYRAAKEWKEFVNILPISASSVDATNTTVITTETTAEITWPQVSGAYTYELVIKDAEGNIICTLVFDSEGHLTSITFHAPTRNNMPQKEQMAGFAFTINGLQNGTTYNYTLMVKNQYGEILSSTTGSFITQSSQNTENLEIPHSNNKILRDGVIYITTDKNEYTIQGTKIK